MGINWLYVCKCLLDLDLTLMNIWRDNYYLENDYDSKTKLSIIFSILHKKDPKLQDSERTHLWDPTVHWMASPGDPTVQWTDSSGRSDCTVNGLTWRILLYSEQMHLGDLTVQWTLTWGSNCTVNGLIWEIRLYSEWPHIGDHTVQWMASPGGSNCTVNRLTWAI